MRHSSSRRLLTKPERYRIRVCGRLGQEWSECLSGMAVSVGTGKSQETITELNGLLPDQAALMGILQHLADHGIAILSMDCLGEECCDE